MSAGPEPRQPARIGVVIPYFQRNAGLLQRALRSVAHQEHPPIQVVVVDDGSPVAAGDEITPELRARLPGLTVICQANRGVAAARNAGLAALDATVSAVAFLDSDDYWQPTHIRNAAAALALGADFFFANHTRGETDVFRNSPSPQRELLLDSPLIDGTHRIGRWSAGVSALFGQGLRQGLPFLASEIVFRRSVKPDLRFPEDFRLAGEDYAVFWELLTRSSQIMFGTEPTANRGTDGVGIYQRADYGCSAHLVRTGDHIRQYRQMVNSGLLARADKRLMQQEIAVSRSEALQTALHLLRRRHNILNELTYLFRSDPLCVVSWAIDLPKILYSKLRRRPAARFTE
jgi:succinoglycan biosynthesis protein ExoW